MCVDVGSSNHNYKGYCLLGRDVTLGNLIDMYQHFQETTASINTVDNGGSRHIAKMCITPYSHRILVATSWKTVTL